MSAHAPAKKWRILLVDDHPIVRGGLVRLIEQEPDMRCCAEAATSAEARAGAVRAKPDLAIVDLRLQSGDGLELIKCFRAELPELKILVLSQHSEPVYVERALRSGALGYVMKDQPPEEVLSAIRAILAGEVYLSRAMASRVLRTMVGGGSVELGSGVEQLTDRELVVLRVLGEGKSTRDAAAEMNVSFKTVESHRENIKRKLGLKNATELVHFATKWANSSVSVPLESLTRQLSLLDLLPPGSTPPEGGAVTREN